MTLTEAQTQFNALADRLSATKAAQKAALAALGRTPTDVWDTYPDELRAVTGGTGNYQESKTVTADPAGMTITPDEGYSGMLKAIIAAEPNFQSYNLVEGIEAWGITGTAKPTTTSDAPTNLPVSKDDADTAYETETGAAPTETDYFVCVDNDGNITYWYLSESFEITSYNPINTDFAAKGAVRLAYHTTGENAGKWTHDNFYDTPSKGWNYLKNIRSCTRDKLYYKGYEVWPDDSEYRASLGGNKVVWDCTIPENPVYAQYCNNAEYWVKISDLAPPVDATVTVTMTAGGEEYPLGTAEALPGENNEYVMHLANSMLVCVAVYTDGYEELLDDGSVLIRFPEKGFYGYVPLADYGASHITYTW